jgi:hypothetical protein
MVSVFSPVKEMEASDYKRVTDDIRKLTREVSASNIFEHRRGYCRAAF